ncbi:hypothetical protein BAUCODRAFT_125858 [Baudoinia panamericana UAMH 10762]|uniref:AMP-dependent synthetase/ligase domain-containing protein n=1 Tax=Baudoinia panamericana (strain UAMH 10762) TaxID=717646 RepID=M2M931_BAUPA|nr:uncharacterized protein BAUCODRAFT_125858 [Baudoinia panamericana UAMH 10762]EMC92901.1 hypothetical protein BAUCODRAFT_125858 [Baudoinia panamericana UAMH 10762]
MELTSGKPALLKETIGVCLSRIVHEYSDRPAVKVGALRLTYRDLDDRTDEVVKALYKLGLSSGDVVATTLSMNINHLLIIYACFKSGIVLAPLNPGYSSTQVVAALQHVKARCWFVGHTIAIPYKQPLSTQPLRDAVYAAQSVDNALLCKVVVVNATSPTDFRERCWEFQTLLRSAADQAIERNLSLEADSTATLLFTSGTTSSPKAVVLSHHNILNNANVCSHLWGTTSEDVYISTMPLYHCGGIVLVLLAAMTHGAMISMPCEAFDALALLRAIREDRCTILSGVPTMYMAWLDLLSLPEFANHDFSHIRSGFIGASPILPSLRETLNQRLHLHGVGNAYGMTESSPVATIALASHPEEKKCSTVGYTIPHQSVRIAARDNPHRTLEVGERGEILIAGMVMRGYLDNQKKTDEAIVETVAEDGTMTRWMRSGDEGMMDADGFVSVTGRIKEEIEDVMMQCAAVKSVSVVGLKDERYGEVVGAFVIPRPNVTVSQSNDSNSGEVDLRLSASAALSEADTSQELTASQLRDVVRAKLAKHMVPKHIFWVDELPMTLTGKIEKHKLRDCGNSLVAPTQATAVEVQAELVEEPDSACEGLEGFRRAVHRGA